MPINRAPWNALVDDDGTNLVGTVWNKDKIKTVILDPADAAYPTKVLLNSDAGTLNDWTPAGFITGQDMYIHWAGTAPATITGLIGDLADGQIVRIKNRSPNGSVLSFVHVSPSSAAHDRFVLPVTSAPMPVAAEGWLDLIYVRAWTSWFCVGYDQGAWINTAFNAAHFWTGITAGHVPINRYLVQNKTLLWMVQLFGAPVPAPAVATLPIRLPGELTMLGSGVFSAVAQANEGAAVVPAAVLSQDISTAGVSKSAGGNWVNAPLYVYFTATVAIT
jgi:hypothetical protein